MNDQIFANRIHINGVVQGVGFRPFIYALAKKFHLTGWVRNTSSGVEIEINGDQKSIEFFIESIKYEPPPLSHIDQLVVTQIEPNGCLDFNISASHNVSDAIMPISADMAICDECKRELFDPNNRRYRYPFINCTNCGPRFSIIKDVPYDRPSTTMAQFEMCPECKKEYLDPLDRRFHAQPIACEKCGPRVWFESEAPDLIKGNSAIELAHTFIRQGKIIAIKGLGGFHLACDAINSKAVQLLRQRKGRYHKPFAVMAFDIETIKNYCDLNSDQISTLLSPQHPIVLLNKKKYSNIAENVAPGQNTIGFMLPYTPLHLLLMKPTSDKDIPPVFVMTSGNISEEPIIDNNEDARSILANISDGFLMHDRQIQNRIDDSVIRFIENKTYPVRRSRGFAPNPIIFSKKLPQVFAGGAEWKNTFCMTRDNYLFISHHIGDLDNSPTLIAYENSIKYFQHIFKINPEIFACDLHPDYLATKYVEKRSQRKNIHPHYIQHHHAHLASCLADNKWDSQEDVVGFCFDGTGYGTDGNIWGSEVMLGNYRGYQRLFHLDYIKMPGGDLAAKKTFRMALSYLRDAEIEWLPELPPVKYASQLELKILNQQLTNKINTPLSSSMGRLFDAVASIIDIKHFNYYEGQAAMELEAFCDPEIDGSYPYEIQQNTISVKPIIQAIIKDYLNGTQTSVISSRFHNTIATIVIDLALSLRNQYGINTIALSGGVWQNTVLLNKTIHQLKAANFNPLIHHKIPPNDGGISLGQAIIAAMKVIS